MKYLLVLITLCLAIPVQAQTEYYKVNLTYTNSSERAAAVFYIPLADAQYYNKRFGTDELTRELQQVVNKIKARIANERDNDLRRAQKFLTPQEKQRILDAEKAYRDTVGTFERSQTQGSLIIKKPEQFAITTLRYLEEISSYEGDDE